MQYFIGYDVGTSSVKCILLDTNGTVFATAIESYPLFTPNPGWVEQEPEDYWNAICKATNRIIQSSNISKVTKHKRFRPAIVGQNQGFVGKDF